MTDNKRPLTKREQRLSRALGDLSARDMQRFLESIVKPYLWTDTMILLNEYADRADETKGVRA